ncbi:MAG: mandelate racemase [Gammaproteobacteria bacterium]|nr:mandelate racemase [Gammaproteobacteria bacterium]MCY4210511.1 mandelate racemase [Gammaproteobacteria bacterium]MCY4281998.1 mandelate racemase [Gammaproteobacteria bacterium]MCY4337273.1 mandelate racemase [Gammaproteobacteria bacterium]
MKITGCEIFLVALPNRRHHTWASKMTAPIGYHAVLRVDTDEGLSGWGEAPAGISWGGPHNRYYGESPETVRHIIAGHLIEAIKGLDPRDIAVIHSTMDKMVKGNPYAKAALDMACYDIAGKAANVPVYRLLGGQFRDRIEVAHSLGIMPVEKCVDEAVTAVEEGAKTLKCKTGLDPARDVEVVRRLRERLGDEVKIRVDGNEGYNNVWEAINVTRRQEEYNILLCEQPLMDNRQLAFVAERIDCPVMADESAWTVHDILELHELKAASCFSCYVTKPGGLYRAMQQADIAGALGMYSDIGGSIESGIGNAANLHLGAASKIATLPSVSPVSSPAGSTGPSVAGIYYLDDLITEPFGFEDGCVLVPQGPGLGIEVDMDKIKRYAAS